MERPPAEFVIQPRIVVSWKTGAKLLRQARAAKPTPALRELMRDGDEGARRLSPSSELTGDGD